MANLFWKQKGEKTLNLLSTPFASEEEFEKVIFETEEILEDIFLIKRQIRGGKKAGIPDIIGIDNDGNVCIVEMKNVAIDASIIPQVLDTPSGRRKIPTPSRIFGLKHLNNRKTLQLTGIITEYESLSLLHQLNGQHPNL